MVPMGLHDVVQFVIIGVHAARSNFVQFGLPDMGSTLVHQGDVKATKPVNTVLITVAELGGQFQATGTSANNHNTVKFFHLSTFGVGDVVMTKHLAKIKPMVR
jgi:hypothetical protein